MLYHCAKLEGQEAMGGRQAYRITNIFIERVTNIIITTYVNEN